MQSCSILTRRCFPATKTVLMSGTLMKNPHISWWFDQNQWSFKFSRIKWADVDPLMFTAETGAKLITILVHPISHISVFPAYVIAYLSWRFFERKKCKRKKKELNDTSRTSKSCWRIIDTHTMLHMVSFVFRSFLIYFHHQPLDRLHQCIQIQ